MSLLSRFYERFFSVELPWNREGKPQPDEEILEEDEMDLNEVLESFASRPEVPKRMLKMAKIFGLSRQQLAHPNKRAAKIVNRCNECVMGDICFKNRDGTAKETPGFRRERCPNLTTYRDIALKAEHRTPIKNKAY